MVEHLARIGMMALPAPLSGALADWDRLDDEGRARAQGDVALMAAIMRTR